MATNISITQQHLTSGKLNHHHHSRHLHTDASGNNDANPAVTTTTSAGVTTAATPTARVVVIDRSSNKTTKLTRPKFTDIESGGEDEEASNNLSMHLNTNQKHQKHKSLLKQNFLKLKTRSFKQLSSDFTTQSSSKQSQAQQQDFNSNNTEYYNDESSNLFSSNTNSYTTNNNNNLNINDESHALFYIKQKYKMYLEWLDENYSSTKYSNNSNNNRRSYYQPQEFKQQQQQQQTTQPHSRTHLNPINNNQQIFNNNNNNNYSPQLHQLNWYKYENSVLTTPQQLKVPPPHSRNHHSHSTSQLSNTAAFQIKQTPITSQLSISSTTSFNSSTTLNSAQTTTLNSKQPLPPVLHRSYHKPKSQNKRQSKSNQPDQLNQSLTNEQQQQQMPQQNLQTINTGNHVPIIITKGVKFDSTNAYCTSQRTAQPLIGYHSSSLNSQQPLKPILKVNNGEPSATSAHQRSSSPTNTASLSTTTFSDDSNKQLKRLPPISDALKQKAIANCSEDFYAVISEMEQNNLV